MKKKYLNFIDDNSNATTAPVDAPVDTSATTNYSQAAPQNLTTAPPTAPAPDLWSKIGSLIGGILGTNKAAATPTYRPVVTTPVNKPSTASSTSWVMPVVVIGVIAVGGFMVYKKYAKK